MSPRHVLVVVVLLGGGTSCVDELAAPAALVSRSSTATSSYRDPTTGVVFEPGDEVSVTAEQFAEEDPGTIRAIYTLATLTRVAISIDVWHNPARVPLAQWFDRHLGFMRDGHAIIGWAPVSRRRAQGMIIDRLRTPQAFAQRVAIVALQDRVLRITCHRQDDVSRKSGAEHARCDRLLASLDLEEVRP